MPEAVTRRGPSRRWVSAPLCESMASLKKFVAIWMATAPSRVASGERQIEGPAEFPCQHAAHPHRHDRRRQRFRARGQHAGFQGGNGHARSGNQSDGCGNPDFLKFPDTGGLTSRRRRLEFAPRAARRTDFKNLYRGHSHEQTHLSALQAHPETTIRLPRPHGHQSRPRHPPPPPPERPQAPRSQGRRDSTSAVTRRSTAEFPRPRRYGCHQQPSHATPAEIQHDGPRGLRAGQDHRSGESRPVCHFKHLGRSLARLAAHRLHHHQTRRQKAHDRNLLRRRFRALVQAHAPDFPEIRRFLVTIARPGAAQATFAELEADWLRQARRLGLFPRPEEKP